MSLDYACEKMTQVVGALAVSVGMVQDRLDSAFQPSFLDTTHDAKMDRYLPEELLGRMQDVMLRMTALDFGDDGQGVIKDTLNAMPDSEAADIAAEMLDIAYGIWQEGNKAGVYWHWSESE